MFRTYSVDVKDDTGLLLYRWRLGVNSLEYPVLDDIRQIMAEGCDDIWPESKLEIMVGWDRFENEILQAIKANWFSIKNTMEASNG